MRLSFSHRYSSFCAQSLHSGSCHTRRASLPLRPYAQRHRHIHRSSHLHTADLAGGMSRNAIRLRVSHNCLLLGSENSPKCNSISKKTRLLSTTSLCASVVKLQSRRHWKDLGKPTETKHGSKMSCYPFQGDRRRLLAVGGPLLWTASTLSGLWA